ncbi:MAG: hypothetical protein Q8S73_15035 [Deltaproteobacteria bacterium]|nr:hypothetical protein [Myxococcales bacterium]MDP3215421.1 hypothetical protein [Deltaproteobacteria bacterium]
MPDAAPDLAVLAVATRRVRWQRALRAAASVAVPALGASVALVLLTRLHVLRTSHPVGLALAPLCLPLLGALVNALRPVRPLDAARRLDAHHHLHDRLGIAWQFRQRSPEARTAFMQAAIDDAATHARGVDVRAALPWRLPPELRVVAVLAALLVLVARVPIPARTPPRPAARAPAVITRDAAELHDDDLAAFREAARQIEAQARTDEARRGVEEFNRLLDDLAHRRLDRDEAFRRLAALQESAAAQDAAAARRVSEALRTMGDEMNPRDPATRRLAEALRQGDAGAASQAMRELSQAMREGSMTPQQRQQAAQALQRAAEARPDTEELRRQVEQARREVEEMLRRQRERALTQPEESLLRRRQNEAQRLTREQQQREEQRREAEHLQRELAQAAQDLARDLQAAGADLQRGAEELSRMHDEQQSQRSNEELRQQLEQLRELMRQQRGQGGQRQRMRLQQFSRNANGQQGQQQGQQGQQGQGNQPGQQGQGGPQGMQPGQGNGPPQGMVLMPGGGGIPLPMPGGSPGQQRPGGQPGQEPGGGSGAGAQHDENLRGAAINPLGRTQAVQVQGQQTGAGPSRSQVIRTAAAGGFASRPYRQVYSPYWDRAREVLHQGEVPPGFRSYVRRYFQLIRPREE